jgi:GT2 family glycosyltransferase
MPSPRETYPLVSIVIPIRDHSIALERCINSIVDQSTYPNFEIVIVSDESSASVIPPSPKNTAIRAVTARDKLNLSQKLNLGIQNASGDFIVTLNSQIKISASDWLQTLLLYFDFRDMGIVAPLLLYPDGTVYHAGLVLGLRDAVDYVMRGYQYDQDGYAGSLSCPREVSAVSMDCMMFRLEDYKQVGGFDEYFNTSHQDVDFCLRLRKQRKRILYVPDVPLTKYELKDDNLDEALLVDTWSEWIKEGDPYYNPNFSRKLKDYELNLDVQIHAHSIRHLQSFG